MSDTTTPYRTDAVTRIDATTQATARDIEEVFDALDQVRSDLAVMVQFARDVQKMLSDVAPVLSGFMPGLRVPGLDIPTRAQVSA